jgi:Xaa-Pro aminopeptidase
MKKFIGIFLFATAICLATAHDFKYHRYDTDILSKEFHRGRREEVRKQMPENSVAVVFSAPVRNFANDVDYQYHQNPNFYYLTGNLEPNSMLIITKNEIELEGRKSNEFLFVRNRSIVQEKWSGRRLGIEGAEQLLGISVVFLSRDFKNMNLDFNRFESILILPYPEGVAEEKSDEDDLHALIESFKGKVSTKQAAIDDFKLGKILGGLREIKQPEELKLLRKAVDISVEAHIEMMRTATARMHEFEVQAIGEYVFKKNGSEYVGYPSICGGRENGCVLHYTTNRKQLSSGDLILLDMGAEYHGYTADVTRTFPLNGKYSPEQKIIYELVLAAQDSGISQCKPGNPFLAPHDAAVAVIAKGLMKLGIIKNEKEVRKYFMHGTSHYLGLDVHDPGTRGSLKPGTVITVEPGIYIPEGSDCDEKWWNIGIRIEDDILIIETGYENLSAGAPRTIAAIEQMMAVKSDIFLQK